MVKCVICGKEIEKSSYCNDILCSSECFSEHHWRGKEEERIKENPRTARIEGSHYYIGDEEDKGGFRGYGGSLFIIKFDDGRIIKTTNLWCQGTIPQHKRESLPNNAVFLKCVNCDDYTPRETTKITEGKYKGCSKLVKEASCQLLEDNNKISYPYEIPRKCPKWGHLIK